MDVQKLMVLAIPAGLLFAAYKFAPNALVKSAVVGVAGSSPTRVGNTRAFDKLRSGPSLVRGQGSGRAQITIVEHSRG